MGDPLTTLRQEARARGLLGGYDALGQLHARLAPDRLERGLFYTPEPLVRWLWTLIDAVEPGLSEGRTPTVLDPACGSGRLLLEAARRGWRTVGIDPDPVALALAREALPRAELHALDALSEAARLPPVDLLIANPPYGRRPPSAFIREQVAPFAFPEHWHAQVPAQERNRGKLVEHCAWFVALAHHRVRPGGTIALLTTNAWLSIPTWRYLRRFLVERWTLRLLVDFNRPSDRRSVFLPDAAIGAAVLVATRTPPPPGHQVKVLDLSELPTVRSRYEALGRCVWDGRSDGHDGLRSFEPHPVDGLGWDEVPQATLRDQPDHRLRRPTPLVRRVETTCARLSSVLETHPGVDPGDLRHLVAEDVEDLERKLVPLLQGRLDGLNRTARAWIARNLHQIGPFRPEDAVPFLFQKDVRPFGWTRLHVTWLHPRVLWRARLHDGPHSPILDPLKLIVLERRERGEVYAVVTDRLLVPQHGGRLLYARGPADVLHALCAVLNSPVYQRYYRAAGQGDKDLPVPDPTTLPADLLDRLAAASRARHRRTELPLPELDALASPALGLG